MQPPWPDAIWVEGDVDAIFRFCDGIYVVADYWDHLSTIVDAKLCAEYYVEYDGCAKTETMADAHRRTLQSVAGYTINHRLDGVELSAYCYTDGKWAALVTETVEWIVFRPCRNTIVEK